MEVVLQESSMIMNPELSFKERVEVIRYASAPSLVTVKNVS